MAGLGLFYMKVKAVRVGPALRVKTKHIPPALAPTGGVGGALLHGDSFVFRGDLTVQSWLTHRHLAPESWN